MIKKKGTQRPAEVSEMFFLAASKGRQIYPKITPFVLRYLQPTKLWVQSKATLSSFQAQQCSSVGVNLRVHSQTCCPSARPRPRPWKHLKPPVTLMSELLNHLILFGIWHRRNGRDYHVSAVKLQVQQGLPRTTRSRSKLSTRGQKIIKTTETWITNVNHKSSEEFPEIESVRVIDGL